jgi:tetratricopeptide (TPR) repeat protein
MIEAHTESFGSADLSDTLYTLADACHAAWKLSGLEATLEEALEAYEQALELRPSGDDRRAKCLSGLGAALSAWCHFHITDIVRTRRSITLLREALRLRPPGHPLRDHSLHALGGALFFNIFEQQLGDRETLLESIPLSRQASHLRPQGHPARDRSLANLATALMRSFEHYGDVSEVAEAITINREILHRRPPGTPSRVNTLNNLGISLIHYFEHCGGFRTIAEAISLLREALKLSPAGHPRRDCALDNLARALWIYGSCQGHSNEALSEVVLLHRESLQLLPDGYPQRAITLRNLANCLLSRSRLSAQSGSRDLAEAICLLREALELQPLRDNFMFNLAEALGAQYTVKGDTSSLLEAIDLHRKALCARPHRHTLRLESLENLARLCRMPCASQSWEDTITLYREALAICPMGYPGRARLLSGMSICFLDPTSPYFNISEGISHLSNGYADKFSHINQRLSSALDDLRRVEDAHRILLEKKDASSGAQDREDILRLYNRVIGLLPHAAHYGLDHDARLHSVEGSDEIARNAAARAVHLERVSQAVELLEEGRGMFWSQSLHLRAPEFDEVPEKDRDELTRLLRLLEHGARRLENSDRTAAERERDLEARRQLNEEAETLISRIRSYPDLRRFLMPPAFISLFNALPDGYVVILNASSLGHHALLLHRTSGLAASLELSSPHQGFDSETIRAQLPRDARSKQCHMGDSTDDDRAVIFSTGRANVKTLNGLLSILWTYIARPLFDELKLQVTKALSLHRRHYTEAHYYRDPMGALGRVSGGAPRVNSDSSPFMPQGNIKVLKKSASQTSSSLLTYPHCLRCRRPGVVGSLSLWLTLPGC